MLGNPQTRPEADINWKGFSASSPPQGQAVSKAVLVSEGKEEKIELSDSDVEADEEGEAEKEELVFNPPEKK